MRYLPEEDIVESYKNGETTTTLSCEYKVTPATILRILRRHNVKVRPPGRRPSEEVRVAAEEAATFRAMGFSCGEIGKRLSVSRQRVFQLVEHMNIKPLNRRTHTRIRKAVEAIESLGAGVHIDGEPATLFDLLAEAAVQETLNIQQREEN
jgi:hypothetical protein